MRRIVATVVFDDCAFFREGLKHVFSITHFRVVKDGTISEGIPPSLLKKSRDVLFLFGCSSDAAQIESQTRHYKSEFPHARVVILGDRYDVNLVSSAVKADADGYVVKTIAPEALIKSLDLVMLGEKVLPNEFLRHLCEETALHSEMRRTAPKPLDARALPPPSLPGIFGIDEFVQATLSSREAAVLHGLMQGESNKCIARKHNIAEATVKVHVKAILRKIHVKNRTQAAMWAANQHWSPDGKTSNGAASGIARIPGPLDDE